MIKDIDTSEVERLFYEGWMMRDIADYYGFKKGMSCLKQCLSKRLYIELIYCSEIHRYIVDVYPQVKEARYLNRIFMFRYKIIAMLVFNILCKL